MLQVTISLMALLMLAQDRGQVPERVNSEETVPVCEVLAAPLKFNGKLVAIRGVWESSGEGSWIGAGTKCSKPFSSYGYVWPQIIEVTEADSPMRLHKVDFHTNLQALQKITEDIAKMKLDQVNHRIWLTFTGVFETRDYQPSDIGGDGRGGRRAFGFGHLNRAPGQILLKTVSSLNVERY
jgi:hypothetical protein